MIHPRVLARRPIPPAPRSNICIVAATALLALLPTAAFAQLGTLSGQIVDATSDEGIHNVEVRLLGLPHATLTNAQGLFTLRQVPGGVLTLWVRHVAYGQRAMPVEIGRSGVTTLRVALSDSAIALAPLEVTALSADARQARGAGYRRNIVTREQLAQAQSTNLTFGEVLRQFVPSVRVRSAEGVVGAASCIELRNIAASRNRCNSPAVYLDGVPVTNAMTIYSAFPFEMIESIEVVPAAEAGGRFGTGALYGALLIESRRPGAADERANVFSTRSPFHDWSAERGGHATFRSFAAAAAGNGLGLAGGLAIANACIGTVPPSHDRVISTCDTWSTVAAATAAVVVPAFTGALGSRLGGRSAGSRGRLLPAAVGAAMAIIPGYAIILTGQRLDSDALRTLGTTTLIVGAPFIAAMADHQFRTVREPELP